MSKNATIALPLKLFLPLFLSTRNFFSASSTVFYSSYLRSIDRVEFSHRSLHSQRSLKEIPISLFFDHVTSPPCSCGNAVRTISCLCHCFILRFCRRTQGTCSVWQDHSSSLPTLLWSRRGSRRCCCYNSESHLRCLPRCHHSRTWQSGKSKAYVHQDVFRLILFSGC